LNRKIKVPFFVSFIVFNSVFGCSVFAQENFSNEKTDNSYLTTFESWFIPIFLFLVLIPMMISIVRWTRDTRIVPKLRAIVGIIISFSSWIIIDSGIQNNDPVLIVLAILLWLVAMIILLGGLKKKSSSWKMQPGIRRHFSKQVRDTILEIQKYRCANCNTKIYHPLIHFDHINGNRSNNNISNCQALCPNCHVLKTDDDRRNQR